MSDLISRADAIDAVHKYFVDKINNEPHEIDEDGDDVFMDMKSVNALFHHNKMVSKAIKALPSTDTLTIHEDGTLEVKVPNAQKVGRVLVMDTDSHIGGGLFYQDDAVQGEWIHDGQNFKGGLDWCHCSECGYKTSTNGLSVYRYCPSCGARMKGGAE